MQTTTLVEAMRHVESTNLQPLGAVVLTAALLGRNMQHLEQPSLDNSNNDSEDDDDSSLDGEFWTRHRAIEAILLKTALGLPDHLRLPANLPDPNIVFFNMSLHTAAIHLHQTAIFKANRRNLPTHIGSDSKIRCITAAGEIASLMRMISHLDLAPVSEIQ